MIFLESAEGIWPANTLILAWWNWFWTSDPQDCERIHSVLSWATRLWLSSQRKLTHILPLSNPTSRTSSCRHTWVGTKWWCMRLCVDLCRSAVLSTNRLRLWFHAVCRAQSHPGTPHLSHYTETGKATPLCQPRVQCWNSRKITTAASFQLTPPGSSAKEAPHYLVLRSLRVSPNGALLSLQTQYTTLCLHCRASLFPDIREILLREYFSKREKGESKINLFPWLRVQVPVWGLVPSSELG